MVERAGFEPAKAEPPDLQSGPVDRLGNPSILTGAEGGTRTLTPFLAPDFESGASTSSTTSASHLSCRAV